MKGRTDEQRPESSDIAQSMTDQASDLRKVKRRRSSARKKSAAGVPDAEEASFTLPRPRGDQSQPDITAEATLTEFPKEPPQPTEDVNLSVNNQTTQAQETCGRHHCAGGICG